MSDTVHLTQEELRQLQLIELEMIVEVDRICRKNHINYSLDGGTLLGAIRHKGFIPWDDDADVIFTRHEYARFYRACKRDLDTTRFFLQEYRTDSNYRWGYAKLRRKNTEFIRAGQEHMKYVTGVCIDVFVNDHVPDQPVLRKLYYGLNFCLKKISYSELGRVQADRKFMRGFYHLLYKIPRNAIFKTRNFFAAIANQRPTELISHLMYEYPSKETKYGMPSKCFEDYISVEFEGMTFQGFREYDLYLRLLYGDYMQLPPEDKRESHVPASKIELIDISLEDIQSRYARENMQISE